MQSTVENMYIGLAIKQDINEPLDMQVWKGN